jgi:RNA polymerase sigma-70 factor (ECF subfamily)
MPDPVEPIDVLIDSARSGDTAALDRLLDMYRNYLNLIARTQLHTGLRLRIDPSDLIQEVLFAASRRFAHFRGTTEAELLAWLRRILVSRLADLAKHHQARRRDVRREVSLEQTLDDSTMAAEQALRSRLSSPSGHAMHREQMVVLADALARLPDDYREVLILRHVERLDFQAIADRMNRAPATVRKLWTRAIERLRSDTRTES